MYIFDARVAYVICALILCSLISIETTWESIRGSLPHTVADKQSPLI